MLRSHSFRLIIFRSLLQVLLAADTSRESRPYRRAFSLTTTIAIPASISGIAAGRSLYLTSPIVRAPRKIELEIGIQSEYLRQKNSPLR